MVVNYLEKIREKFQAELIELNLLLNKALCEQRENIEIIKMLEINDDPNFESFTPRPVNSFNKTKILELKEELNVLDFKITESISLSPGMYNTKMVKIVTTTIDKVT